jgi:hypothetical protein
LKLKEIADDELSSEEEDEAHEDDAGHENGSKEGEELLIFAGNDVDEGEDEGSSSQSDVLDNYHGGDAELENNPQEGSFNTLSDDYASNQYNTSDEFGGPEIPSISGDGSDMSYRPQDYL